MAVYNSHNTKQWEELLNAINGGDTSAIATALTTIKTSIDSINTSLGSLSTDVIQDSTQWTNLVNAITNQSLTVDLSSVTSSVVSNLSNVTGSNLTDVINLLNSEIDNKINNFTYAGSVNGSNLFNLPSIWKELHIQVVMRSTNICSSHLYNVQTSNLVNTSLGNFGTSYVIGKLSRTQYQLSTANWGGTNITSEAKTYIYYR